jgi:lipid-binding SYLF domain-containing protein
VSDGVARADSAQLLPLDLLRRARGIAVISVARAGLVWGAAVGRFVIFVTFIFSNCTYLL